MQPSTSQMAVNKSVFFSGVPLTVERERLRQLFESVGHVVDLRLFNPTPGKSVRHGLVEYMDERSAAEAMARLNGTMLGGERAMRVVAAQPPRNDRKRTRDAYDAAQPPLPGGRDAGAFSADAVPRRDARMAVNAYNSGSGSIDALRPRLYFGADVVDPLLGRGDTSVLTCLSDMPIEQAYEAVEQLRVLALERPHDAKRLLRDNAVLRSAVVLILQHAGRLPFGSLPPEAYARSSSNNSSNSTTTTATTAASAATTTTTESQRDEVLQLIRCMREDDVERVLRMSDADLAAVADVQQRQQLAVLRRRLRDMSSTL